MPTCARLFGIVSRQKRDMCRSRCRFGVIYVFINSCECVFARVRLYTISFFLSASHHGGSRRGGDVCRCAPHPNLPPMHFVRLTRSGVDIHDRTSFS